MAIVKKFRITNFKNKTSLISLKNISIAFNKNHQILDNISVDVPKGQVLGLLGPNGAGKSTIMNIISGLLKPDFGTIEINGSDITNYPIYLRATKYKISIIPQFGGMFANLSSEDNLKAVGEVLIKDKTKLWGVFRNVVLKPAGVPLGEWDIENQCRKKK